jgi:hypothetical protein
MPGDVLSDIFTQIETVLDAIIDPFTSAKLFGTPKRIFYQGEQLLTVVMPSCAVRFGDEVATGELETTGKVRHQLPWEVQVFFNTVSFGTPATLIQGHTRLYGLVKEAIYADRTIAGKVIDTRYVGGGTALDAEDEEDENVDRWTFTMRFESLYGHVDTDTDTPA